MCSNTMFFFITEPIGHFGKLGVFCEFVNIVAGDGLELIQIEFFFFFPTMEDVYR